MARVLFFSGAVIAMCLIPVSLTVSQEGPGIRVSEACAQATSCKKQTDYICSTFNEDHVGYVCWTGCAPQQE